MGSPRNPLLDPMPCRARLTATVEHAPNGAQCFTIASEGAEEARVIMVHAVEQGTGKECSWIIEKPTVRRLAPGETMGLEVGDGSGPVDLIITVTWVDNAGIPGVWTGPVHRERVKRPH